MSAFLFKKIIAETEIGGGRPTPNRSVTRCLPQHGHERKPSSSNYNGPVLRALSKSEIRSSTCSIPTDIRMRSSVKPLASRTAAGMLAWDMKQGMLMRDFTLPVDTEIKEFA